MVLHSTLNKENIIMASEPQAEADGSPCEHLERPQLSLSVGQMYSNEKGNNG
jgi:hypothetical protein